MIMNIVFICGEILEGPEFKFIVEGKHISVVLFSVRLTNNSILKIKAYDEVADRCYMNLNIGSRVVIQGSINSVGEIEAEKVNMYYEPMVKTTTQKVKRNIEIEKMKKD